MTSRANRPDSSRDQPLVCESPTSMGITETVRLPEKDFPLRDDIRLLGRILGDTIREQQGDATFEIVERIRQTSIRFHRNEDEAARMELEVILNSLSGKLS